MSSAAPVKSKDASKDGKDKKDGKKEVKAPEVKKPLTPAEEFDRLTSDVVASVNLIERSVAADDRKFALRALRKNSALRRRLSAALFARVLPLYYPESQKDLLARLLSFTNTVAPKPSTALDVDATTSDTPSALKAIVGGNRTEILPEVDAYFRILAHACAVDALAAVRDLRVQRRRSLEPLSWRVERYAALAAERVGVSGTELANARTATLAALRRAALRHDSEGTATLLCIVLRSYILERQYALAFKLFTHTPLATESLSSGSMARLLYYQGRIKAVQLEYSEAYVCLSQAARKAPRQGANGFRLAVERAAVVVQLLMGEVPEREVFATPALAPYLALARAVRVGDVLEFGAALTKYGELFARDGLLSLVDRLRHNVLKTGLRKLTVSYSRISLVDVAARLRLDSAADAESIVAKAIRDGVIEGTIDHDAQCLISRAKDDIYATFEPTLAYHARIEYCLKAHDEAVQAMRYPEKMSADDEEQKERDRAQREERELVATIEDAKEKDDDGE